MSSEIESRKMVDFWEMAYQAALRSEDNNTQVGACLEVRFGKHITIGWNYEIANISNKLGFVHAEMDVITKAINTQGSTLYCTWGCCTNCAKLIVQSGVVKMVTAVYRYEKWEKEIKWGHQILRDNGVAIEIVKPFGPLKIGGVLR